MLRTRRGIFLQLDTEIPVNVDTFYYGKVSPIKLMAVKALKQLKCFL